MKQIMLMAVCFAAAVVHGQDSMCARPKIVTTTGTAEIKVTPDHAVLRLGVERQSVNAKSAKAAVTEASRKILAALRASGVDDKDIQTAYLYLEPMINYRKGTRITSFTAEQSLTVRVGDLSRLDGVMDAVMSAGVNHINGIEYGSGDLRKYKDQARDEAAKAAREKAEALARALGNQVGKTYSIEEVQQNDDGYYGGLMANASADKRDASALPSTAPGQLTVKASVTVSFELQ